MKRSFCFIYLHFVIAPAVPSLATLVLDSGCKFLFQLARSDNPAVLNASLRTTATIFDTMRPHLKLQQELFLAFTMDRLAPPLPLGSIGRRSAVGGSPRSSVPSSPALGPQLEQAEPGTSTPSRVLSAPARGETRDSLLETLAQIARHPSFMVDLYVNYDCDVNCENMFERVMDFCTKVSLRASFSIGKSLIFRTGRKHIPIYWPVGCSCQECTVSLSRSLACICE
jgi:golgi-specific brefeldin A-resistance guanine nucleotide exchange factor 1